MMTQRILFHICTCAVLLISMPRPVSAGLASLSFKMDKREYQAIRPQLKLTPNQKKMIEQIYRDQFKMQQTLIKEGNAKIRIQDSSTSTLSKQETEQLRRECLDIEEKKKQAFKRDDKEIRILLSPAQIKIWYTYKFTSRAYLVFENDFDVVPKKNISQTCEDEIRDFMSASSEDEGEFREAYKRVDRQIQSKIDKVYATRITITKQWQSEGEKVLPMLKQKLKSGTPKEKEEVLNIFMDEHIVAFVPDIIDAILDDTVSPRHIDTGWGRVHHQAATAMCKFARRFDGKSQKERGRDKYSFHNDGGVGTGARIKEVHKNWAKWWKENEKNITKR